MRNVLFVPDLSYNLLSVSKAAQNGKKVEFGEEGCKILNNKCKVIATAEKVGNLYLL